MDETTQDMTLVVIVKVSGRIHEDNTMKIKTKFKMATCLPPLPSKRKVIDHDGNIDLREMKKSPAFTGGTDIYFIVEGKVKAKSDGSKKDVSYPVFFQSPASDAARITGKDDNDAGIAVSFPGNDNASMLLFDDLDKNDEQYQYVLNITARLDAGGLATGSIDPAIVNRGDGV